MAAERGSAFLLKIGDGAATPGYATVAGLKTTQLSINGDAVAITMATAGRSITYSALTVLLAMFVLTLLFNLLIVRSISLGVMLVAFTGLLAGLTLLPAAGGRATRAAVVHHPAAKCHAVSRRVRGTGR